MEISITTLSEFGKDKIRATKEQELRTDHGSSILVLFEIGNYFVMYGESARAAAEVLNTETHERNREEIFEIPTRLDYMYFPKLVKRGYKMVIIQNYL